MQRGEIKIQQAWNGTSTDQLLLSHSESTDHGHYFDFRHLACRTQPFLFCLVSLNHYVANFMAVLGK